MGGGGGDGGFGARQDAQDAEKARARQALNVLFGVAPTGGGVDRSRFVSTTPGAIADDSGMATPGVETFDQGGFDAATAEQSSQAAEAERNRRGLEELFGSVRSGAFNAGKRRLDEQKGEAERQLKFELFARGQNAGSVDIDQNALLGRTYGQGITDLGGRADAAAADARSTNEATRLQLLQAIDSGMDQGSAISSALGQMRANSDRATAGTIGTSVGDLFSNVGLLYEKRQASQGRNNWPQYMPPGFGSAPRGSSSARGGIVSPS
jgi:hypothetical protein